MITIGIDPGLSGAVGVLSDGAYVAVEDMPVVAKGAGSVKNEVAASALKTLILRVAPLGAACAVVVERVNAMPGQGVSSVFSLGDSFGVARAVVASLGFELHYVAPVTWKKHFSLASDKEMSRALASRLFPQAPLTLKKHSDRAEALLMARWLHDTRFR